MQYSDEHLRYLRLLSQKYQTVAAAASEIIRIEALLRLPKGTEHFMSDLHGEHEAFVHILNSASGVIREKIDTVLGTGVSAEERAELATLVYYPNQKLPELKARQRDLHAWYRMTLLRLIDLCRFVSSKHTRDHVRRCLPQNCGYILDELLNVTDDINREYYYSEIISAILETGIAEDFIIAVCSLIRSLTINRLHIIGDIFDRGPGPHFIMDYLCEHNSFDVQWGNHDVVWMGAALGHMPCIANIIRNSLRYDGLDILEDGYGINMTPLLEFAAIAYADDPCLCYKVKDKEITKDRHMQLTLKMHKAISVIQWKVEGQLISRRPEYNMDDRRLLHLINYEKGTITLDGKE